MPDNVKNILVVDDDPTLCMLLWHTLNAPDMAVISCGNAGDAARLLAEQSFDIVLLDLGLPDGNGLDLLKRFGESETTRFIIITADNTSEALIEAVRGHAYDYIRKPFEPHQIRAMVKSALAAPQSPPIEVISAKPEWFELSVPCTQEAADRIDNFMRQLKLDLPEETRDAAAQAFHELLMNAVEWGGGFNPERRVRISCLRTRRMLQYRIADPGPGFRIEDLDHAAIGHAPENPFAHMEMRESKGMRPGGLGLVMVRALADELLYNEAHNEVVFIKYLDGAGGDGDR